MDLIRASLESYDKISPRVEDEVDGEIIKGAVDYVLLPLVILGVAAPIFVIMFIIMASVEFRLRPLSQAGRGSEFSVFGSAAKFLESYL